MKVIYKYRLPFMEESKVIMPLNSRIIRVDGMDGALWLWAIVDTDNPTVERTFNLYKTGGEMPDNIHEAIYHGCGAIHIQMELMMYVFEFIHLPVYKEENNTKFDWKAVQENVSL